VTGVSSLIPNRSDSLSEWTQWSFRAISVISSEAFTKVYPAVKVNVGWAF
jgi:hypothetical protein